MNTNQKLSALVFGGSGLTGKFLTELLIADTRYDRITLFVRKEIPVYHGKVRQVLFNPDDLAGIADKFEGDQVFCCLGTTIKKAGSKDAFFKTDHDLVCNIAKIAFSKEISTFTVISSLGANADSANFYLRTKGMMEQSLKKTGISNLIILRPSMLMGFRSESRPMEDFGKSISNALAFLFVGPIRKYKPIHAETVARAMIKAANENPGISVIESDSIESLGTIPQ